MHILDQDVLLVVFLSFFYFKKKLNTEPYDRMVSMCIVNDYSKPTKAYPNRIIFLWLNSFKLASQVLREIELRLANSLEFTATYVRPIYRQCLLDTIKQSSSQYKTYYILFNACYLFSYLQQLSTICIYTLDNGFIDKFTM